MGIRGTAEAAETQRIFFLPRSVSAVRSSPDPCENTMESDHKLAFERPIYELEARLKKLDGATEPTPEIRSEVRRCGGNWSRRPGGFTPTSSPGRRSRSRGIPIGPRPTDYIELVFDEFVELHGDRVLATIGRSSPAGPTGHQKVMVIGHQKGQTLKEDALQFRLRPSRGLSQGDGQDAARRQVPACRSSVSSTLPGLIRASAPRARPGPDHRRVDVLM